jgi:fructose-bisphosphate aldolase, class II
MPLARMDDLLGPARAAGRAVGAMNVIALELAEAIVTGAEHAAQPVVLQISENTVGYHGALAPIAHACLAIAEQSSTEVRVHLDHAVSIDLVQEAVRLGLPSVMYDASALDFDVNLTSIAEVARHCHEHGVAVEAELGDGEGGVHAPNVRTDPGEAADYVARTGIDSLAVAVGSSHAMTTRDAVLDDALIAELADAVDIPPGAARLVRRAGRRPGERGRRRHHQGQHRHSPQRGAHPPLSGGTGQQPGFGRPEAIPRPRSRGRGHRGSPAPHPARPRQLAAEGHLRVGPVAVVAVNRACTGARLEIQVDATRA